MKRREFIAVLAGAAAWPLAARGERAAKIYRVGFLSPMPEAMTADLMKGLRDGLRERGYVEGQNLIVDFRWLGASYERGDESVAELVRSNVDAIVAWTTPSAVAARRATTTVPIVIVAVADPVGLGFVASLARPGGNVTGVSNLARDLSGKMLELLLEIVPGTRRLGVLTNSHNPGVVIQLRQVEDAARPLGLELDVVDASTLEDFEKAFAHLAASGVKGVDVLADASVVQYASRIAELARQARLPTVFQRRESVDAGGLLSYGPSLREQFRQAAGYVDRILKGANPASLPVEQPTKFELVINLKTAKALGLVVPPRLLAVADEIIE